MEVEEVIRAFVLKPGNIFKLGRTKYKVRRIENGKIYYYYFSPSDPVSGRPLETMGAHSNQKLILITNKTKQNEHQNRSCNFCNA